MYDNWYAVQVRSGQEEEIVRKCEILVKKDIYEECFIPRYKHMKKFRGKWHEIEDIFDYQCRKQTDWHIFHPLIKPLRNLP